jgi:hypothetical protein
MLPSKPPRPHKSRAPPTGQRNRPAGLRCIPVGPVTLSLPPLAPLLSLFSHASFLLCLSIVSLFLSPTPSFILYYYYTLSLAICCSALFTWRQFIRLSWPVNRLALRACCPGGPRYRRLSANSTPEAFLLFSVYLTLRLGCLFSVADSTLLFSRC